MASLSNEMRNILLDHLIRGQSWTPPVAVYVALCTSPCTDMAPGTEPVSPSYRRAQISCNLTSWSSTISPVDTSISTGTSGVIYNIVPITWPQPAEDWGAVTHLAIFDSQTGGRYLMWTALERGRDLILGDSAISIQPGDLSLSIDNKVYSLTNI